MTLTPDVMTTAGVIYQTAGARTNWNNHVASATPAESLAGQSRARRPVFWPTSERTRRTPIAREVFHAGRRVDQRRTAAPVQRVAVGGHRGAGGAASLHPGGCTRDDDRRGVPTGRPWHSSASAHRTVLRLCAGRRDGVRA